MIYPTLKGKIMGHPELLKKAGFESESIAGKMLEPTLSDRIGKGRNCSFYLQVSITHYIEEIYHNLISD